MLNIALFGPPGAGKGTQSQWLIPHLDLVHISPGDILRENVRLQTALGKQVKADIEAGLLVSNELIIKAVADTISQHAEKAKGFLFDGYPRTHVQAEALDKQLALHNKILDMVLFLEVPEKESYDRIKKRREEIFRADDQNDENIATRFHYYYNDTLPITQYYKYQEKLIHIPGEFGIPKVRDYIYNHIEAYLNKNTPPNANS